MVVLFQWKEIEYQPKKPQTKQMTQKLSINLHVKFIQIQQ